MRRLVSLLGFASIRSDERVAPNTTTQPAIGARGIVFIEGSVAPLAAGCVAVSQTSRGIRT